MIQPAAYFAVRKPENSKLMTAKRINVYTLIDRAMTRLFQLAEYICEKTACAADEPAPAADNGKREMVIRFTHDDKMVEGDLFEQAV